MWKRFALADEFYFAQREIHISCRSGVGMGLKGLKGRKGRKWRAVFWRLAWTGVEALWRR